MPEPPPPSPDPPGQRVWRALCQGGLLLLVLCFFRFEKALVLRFTPTAGSWPAFFLPELGFVLAFEGLWASLGLIRTRWAVAAWRLLFPLAHLAVYGLALADHIFFLRTGTRLQLDLLSYAVGNARMLTGLLATGVDAVLAWRAVLILACLGLGWSVGRKPSPLPARRLATLALASLAAGLLILIVRPAPLGRQAAALANSPVPEFFRSLLRHEPSRAEVAADLLSPEQLYQHPEVTAPAANPGDRPPNVVLVILESTRRDAVPAYGEGASREYSPALADLTPRAVVFEDVYTSVPHTSKALVGILCGMFPHLEMPIVESLRDNLPLACLPPLLARLGYRAAFLQTALGAFENRPGLVRNIGYPLAAFQETLGRGRDFGREGYLGMDEMAMLEPAIEWAVGGGPEPFFLTLLTVTPHHPYEVAGEPWDGVDYSQYLRAIHHQDGFVGALYRGLAETGALADTVVVLVGDHGEAFGEHQALQHDAVPYDEVVRVPLLLLGPERRIGPPRRVGGLRHHFDLLPTLLELAGAEWTGVVPGRSLLTSEGHPRVFSYCWYPNSCAAMREGDEKFVYHFGHLPTELFDLAADPGEEHDLAAAVDPARIAAAERRIVAMKLSTDAFYAQFPRHEGEPLWWNAELQAGATP